MLPKKNISWFLVAIAFIIFVRLVVTITFTLFTSPSAVSLVSGVPNPSPVVKTALLAAAQATLTPTKGNQVTGEIKFVQSGESMTITANITGLQPNSVHGWHIHEFGDLSSPDGKAMGGHFNPNDTPHGLPSTSKRHAGDLGNLTADNQGKVQTEITVNNVTVNGSQNSILGRGLIIHAETDDGGQPAGNAGSRIAQGVIGLPKA